MNNLFKCVCSAGLVLVFIRFSDEVPGSGNSVLVANLELLQIQQPEKTRETLPEASDCQDGDCVTAAIVQDLAKFLYERHTSITREEFGAERSPRQLILSANSTGTPTTGGAAASNSVVDESAAPQSTAQCGVPSVTPNVPEIDQVANYVENLAKSVDSTDGRLVRHGNVVVRQGRPAVFPVMNVAGGSVSVAHSWPWQISMNVYGMHFCGGVILHRRWILTAAHCAAPSWVAGYVKISCGKHDLALYEGEQRLEIKRVILHEQYSRSTLDNDIALLELKKDIVFNGDVSPVCLPVADVQTGQMCMTTGWGKTQGTGPANLLNQVALPVIDMATCRQTAWYGARNLSDNVFCAGFENGGRDSCSGDSGGPFVCRTGGAWQLNGVISWGYGCALPKKPGVYTRVSKYVDWIEAKTAGDVTSSSSSGTT